MKQWFPKNFSYYIKLNFLTYINWVNFWESLKMFNFISHESVYNQVCQFVGIFLRFKLNTVT